MKQKSKSEVTGELSVEEGKQPSAMPSSEEASTLKPENQSISDMSVSSPNQPNPIGFRRTPASREVDDATANLQILLAFADKLAGMVFWKKLELADKQVVIALCFPMSNWSVNEEGQLVAKSKKTS
jgi:hypothetical protein